MNWLLTPNHLGVAAVFSKVEECRNLQMARHVFASLHVTSLLAGVFQN
jgi:hypothetical protein